MNFFKSVFPDDPDNDPTPKPETESPKQPESPNSTSAWSFHGLLKTIATRSESVIDTYSRDLKEFGSGLKKEIQVAQTSLNTVTHVIDEFGNTVIKGTTQIISQGKDAILAVDLESDSSDSGKATKGYDGNLQRKYSRFDAQLNVIRTDIGTYCEDPYDVDDYREWKAGFVLNDEEIEMLVSENADVAGMFRRFVPGSVDYESFWFRYFYKVFKLKQAEDMRARIVKRAISREQEEELSWDVDDSDSDDEGETSVQKEVLDESSRADGDDDDAEEDGSLQVKSVQNEEIGAKASEGVGEKEDSVRKSHVEKGEVIDGEGETSSDSGNSGKETVVESSSAEVSVEGVLEKGDSGLEKKELDSKSDEKVDVQEKADDEETRKDSDVSVVSSQQPEEEDLGWDEIEDLSGIDDKKSTDIPSPKRAELRKRLSAAEEEEDLSWDIEDDD